jgi:hypothetical protein
MAASVKGSPDEYEELDSPEIDHLAGKTRLRLSAKSGQAFNKAEIEKNLDHAETKLHPNM